MRFNLSLAHGVWAGRLAQSLILILLAAVFISGCGSKKKEVQRGSEQDIYNRAQRYLNSSNWELAITQLQSLEEYYPFGTYAEQSQLELIYAFYKAGEHESAVASADRFIRLHPQHRHVDYAFYLKGIAAFYNDSVFSNILPTDVTQRDAGTAKDAFNHFEQLIRLYPDSPYALDAQRRMIYLRNVLARSEINIANYYFKRGAYLAAANRGRWVVENMQMTPAVPDGLAVMAQGYHLLGMQELADKAVTVLAHNYPNYPGLVDGEFDYQYARDDSRSWVSHITFGVFDKAPTIRFDTRELYAPNRPDEEPIAAPPRS